MQPLSQEPCGHLRVEAATPCGIVLADVVENTFFTEMNGVDLKVPHVIRAVRIAHELAVLPSFQARQGQQHIGRNTMPNCGSNHARNGGGAKLRQWIAWIDGNAFGAHAKRSQHGCQSERNQWVSETTFHC